MIGWLILVAYLVGGFLAFRWTVRWLDEAWPGHLELCDVMISFGVALMWPVVWPTLWIAERGARHDWELGERFLRLVRRAVGLR